VIATVLAEVALLTTRVDLRRDGRTSGDQLVELGLQPVVSVLRKPGLGRL
jgi:hypothetical protein